jgi:hypothetical protein
VTEQLAADLFSEQIDRLLGGEAVADIPGIDDWPELATLGEQLSQVGFQPTAAAQAAFHSQLATWFGLPGGGSPTMFLGMSKNFLLGLGATILAIGSGLGLVLLMGVIWPGIFASNSEGDVPAPATIESPLSAPPVLSPVDPEEEPVASPAFAGDTLPDADFSLNDTLPTATPLRGDTLPPVTKTPKPTSTPIVDTPPEPISDDEPGSTETGAGPTGEDDHDRGHGNDPDGHDEDNPGRSTGPGQDNSHGGDRGGGKKK